MRRGIDHVAKSGVVVIQDRELKYVEDFIQMSNSNCHRHGVRPPSREEVMAQLSVFRDKQDCLLPADGQPTVALLCCYTPSTCYLAKVGSHEKDTRNANRLCLKQQLRTPATRGTDSLISDTQRLQVRHTTRNDSMEAEYLCAFMKRGTQLQDYCGESTCSGA